MAEGGGNEDTADEEDLVGYCHFKNFLKQMVLAEVFIPSLSLTNHPWATTLTSVRVTPTRSSA